jgi:hypothetical protein
MIGGVGDWETLAPVWDETQIEENQLPKSMGELHDRMQTCGTL